MLNFTAYTNRGNSSCDCLCRQSEKAVYIEAGWQSFASSARQHWKVSHCLVFSLICVYNCTQWACCSRPH